MPLFIKSVFSKSEGAEMHLYDLLGDTYLGDGFVVTLDLDLRPLSHEDALKKLYIHEGVFGCSSLKQGLRALDDNR